MEKRKCNRCKISKSVTDFNIKTDSTQPDLVRLQAECIDCEKSRRAEYRKKIDVRRFCTFKLPDGVIVDWVRHQRGCTQRHVDKGGVIIDDWRQKRPGSQWPKREDLLLGVLPKVDFDPNMQADFAAQKSRTAGPVVRKSRVLKPKSVPSPYRRRVERDEWYDSGTLRAIRYNLMLKHGVCELTAAHERFCHGSHILARHLCRAWGHEEWVKDEENVIFVQSGFNSGMDKECWIDPDGQYRLPDGADYDEWLTTLGVPEKSIQMYGKRAWFATMAALGDIIPMFDNGPFIKP